jgi:hypothetical protein
MDVITLKILIAIIYLFINIFFGVIFKTGWSKFTLICIFLFICKCDNKRFGSQFEGVVCLSPNVDLTGITRETLLAVQCFFAILALTVFSCLQILMPNWF